MRKCIKIVDFLFIFLTLCINIYLIYVRPGIYVNLIFVKSAHGNERMSGGDKV